MHVWISIPLLVSVAGLLLYFMSSHAKVQEAGRLMFACGLLAALLSMRLLLAR